MKRNILIMNSVRKTWQGPAIMRKTSCKLAAVGERLSVQSVPGLDHRGATKCSNPALAKASGLSSLSLSIYLR